MSINGRMKEKEVATHPLNAVGRELRSASCWKRKRKGKAKAKRHEGNAGRGSERIRCAGQISRGGDGTKLELVLGIGRRRAHW